MIIMRVKLDNICQFNDFDVNFTYPKKIVDSTIEQEHLKDLPNFRYKKLVVIMGQNASGKTTFGRILMELFNAIKNRDFDRLGDMISDRSREAFLMVEFVLHTNTLYRFELSISNNLVQETDEHINDSVDILPEPYVVKYRLKKCTINKTDNYQKCVSRLDKIQSDFTDDLGGLRKEKLRLGWFFAFSKDESILNITNIARSKNSEMYLKALQTILMALDSSIDKVEWKSIESEKDAISIGFKNSSKSVLLSNGGILNKNILSSGTLQAIGIAELMVAALNHSNGFYYCDEKFSYVQTEFETAILSFLIGCLEDREQLFFTTHNYEVLDMALPKHSYLFFKKYIDDNTPKVKAIFADSILKKNTDSLKNAYENDLFSVLPSTDSIFQLLERDADAE